MKKVLSRFFLIILGIFLTLTLLEIFLRLFPVADVVSRLPMNETQPLAKFQPNRSVIYSLGWNFYQIAYKKTNNDGFYNNLNYTENPNKPVIAVIGDSYVEAMQVNNENTFFALLQKEFPNYYFYSFGASGAQLPTYLTYAKYAVKKYKAKKLIFIIISNDFDESFYEYKNYAGFQYFTHNGTIYTVYYKPSKIKRLLKKSTLVRYLFFNLQVNRIIWRITQAGAYKNKSFIDKRINSAKEAIDIFFKLLKKEIPLKHSDIIFVVDAPRRFIYENKVDLAKKSYFGITRNYFIEKAKQNGFIVIDMFPIFEKYYKIYKARFEFPTDAHWNEVGHYVVYKALKEVLSNQK